jgi:hypothetical protein
MNSVTAKMLLGKIFEKRSEGANVVKDAVKSLPPPSAESPDNLTDALSNIGETTDKVLSAPWNWLFPEKAQSGTAQPKPEKSIIDQINERARSWYENDMVRRAGLLGLAGGAGIGGIYALSKMFNKPRLKSKINRNFDFAYPVERVKESEEQGWSNYLLGSGNRTPSILDNPLMLSTLALAGGGALLGGYKGTQLLTDAILKKTQDDERRKAERDFHDALLSNYAAPLAHDPHVKKSSTATMTEVGQALDSLYETLTEKIAGYPGVSTGSAVNDILAGLPALYLLYAGAAGLGTGALAYDYTRKGSKAEALKNALRERDSARYQNAPPELYATAEPIDISRPVSRKEQRSAVV